MTACTPLLLAALIGAASVPIRVFEEEFDRYAEHPEIFSEKSHIEEEPGSVKRMNFTPDKQEALRKTPFAVPDDPVNFDFKFDFRFAADSKREFTVQLFMADPEKPKAAPSVLNMKITEKGSSISTLAGHNGMDWNPGQDGPLPGFPDYFMHKVRLEVRGGYARLYIQREGKWYLESQRQILKKKMTLSGFNVLAASQVTLDSIQIWKYPDDAKSPAFQKEFAFDGKEAEFEVADLPYPAQYQMQLFDEKENKTQVSFRSIPEKKYVRISRNKDGKTVYDSQVLPDAGFQVTVTIAGTKAKEVRTRPNLARYLNEGIAEMAAKWESFPAASKTPMRIRLKQTAPGVCELWLNEKMAFQIKTEAELKKIVFQMPGGTLRTLAARQIPASKEFQVVDPAASLNFSKLWANPATNRLAKYSEVCGVPFLSAKEYSFPLSVCEENKGNYALECDGYLERQAFDAMPSSVHFSVPAAQYIKAYALCSVDPKATPDMVPEVTARLTDYTIRGGRGNGFSHHTVRLPAKPGDPLPPNVKIAGGTKENPIYFVEFNIDAGAIEDIIFREGNTTLDFEFLGRLYEKDNFYQNRASKPSLTKSSVILHAATLKQTPAELRVDQILPGALWYLNENPRMNVHVKPLEKGSWTVKTEISDLAGKVLTATAEKVSEEKALEIRFPQKEYGWYGVKTVLEDAAGTPLVTRNSSFVLLPPDTRKAGMESPYHAWQWEYLYGGDIRVWGEMLKRMGTRHVTGLKNEAEGAPWKLSKGQLPQLPASRFRTAEKHKEAIENEVANFPHCKTALVLHEYAANTPWPLELIGKKTVVTPEQEERDKKAVEFALATAKVWREVAPDIRLLTGNTVSSLGVLSMLFRQKYPRELIDAMGDENGNIGLGSAPEAGIGYNAWALTKLAEVFGYKDLKPDACYEFKIRNNRNASPDRFASTLIRDNLISFAWNYTLFKGGSLGSHKSPYYDSNWGDGGSFSRRPLWDPKPAAAAYATQTLVLDCAKYSRMIPTGSDTVYAEEFRRGNEYIYALWTARGETAADLTFEKPASVLRTEMYGKQINEKTNGNALEIPVSDDPVYLTTTVPLKSVQVKAFRTFNKEPLPAGKMDLVCAMDDASAWDAVSGVDPRILIGGDEQKHLFEPAKFEIRTADDEVKGKTVEVELAKDENCPELVQETGFIRLKTPIEIPGKPHTLGVSCKGNSSWGRIFFEITDAEDEVFLSAGTGGYYCPTYDWDFTMGLNYDNWNTLKFPLTEASPVKVHSPGENQWQWQRSGGKFANGRVDYPVKLTAIGFTMFRKFLIINQMKETGRTIRFRDFVSWE